MHRLISVHICSFSIERNEFNHSAGKEKLGYSVKSQEKKKNECFELELQKISNFLLKLEYRTVLFNESKVKNESSRQPELCQRR